MVCCLIIWRFRIKFFNNITYFLSTCIYKQKLNTCDLSTSYVLHVVETVRLMISKFNALL